MMSGRFRNALSSVPQTKPSWTAIVNQLALESERFHSQRNAGTTAEPLNQSDIASSSAIETKARIRHRCGGAASTKACRIGRGRS